MLALGYAICTLGFASFTPANHFLHAAASSKQSSSCAPVQPRTHVQPQAMLHSGVREGMRNGYGPPNEYQLNLGKAINALRRDYPLILTDEPDFSIFDQDVRLLDPSGVRLHGLGQYENLFKILRFLRTTAMTKDEVTYRLVVSDDIIRVRWTAKLMMRGMTAGVSPALVQVDGISAYELNSKGRVAAHRLENIVMNGPDAQQLNLGFAWPTVG